MPGDPLRAMWIAEHFLKNAKQVNTVRGALGYTGFTSSGKRISVMASGMGQPSIGIYSHELYTEYGVEAIIRVGTCGAYPKNIKVKDIIIAQGACSDFNYIHDMHLDGVYSAIADYSLLEAAVSEARKNYKNVYVGNILSSNIFYGNDKDAWKKWNSIGVLGVEMESYALYCTAALLKKKALCILTVSDHFQCKISLSSEERRSTLNEMIKIAVKVAEKFA